MIKSFVNLTFAAALAGGCSNLSEPSLPDEQQILADIEGSDLSNQINVSWRFDQDDEYIQFKINDKAVFEKDAVIDVDAIGNSGDGRTCTTMKFKVNYKLDNNNTWRLVGRPQFQNSWRDIGRYTFGAPECQASI